MKNFVFIIFSLILLGCNDESLEVERKEETRSISSTETLEFYLAKGIPIEGGLGISQQAENYSISEIQHREDGVYYVYAPEESFIGTDLVKIRRSDSNGAQVYSETITTLKIKVTE